MAPSLGANIIIISIVFSIIPLVFVLLRFRARLFNRVGFALDDYLILPGLVVSIALNITNIIAVVYGNLGSHIHMDAQGIVFDHTLTVFLLTEWIIQLLSVLSLTFTKLSILFFYRRIFRGAAFSVLSWILVGVVLTWGIGFFFATLFECTPVDQVWKTLFGTPEHAEYCYNSLPMFLATAISNMLVDIAIITLPLLFIWRLKLGVKQKFAVSGLFLMGGLVTGITIARIYFFYQSTTDYANAFDITMTIAPTLYWSAMEASIAIISACLPTLRPLFTGISLGSFMHSIASKFSLRSGTKTPNDRTTHAVGDWDRLPAEPGERSGSNFVSQCKASPGYEGSALELQGHSAIRIETTFDQSEHDRYV